MPRSVFAIRFLGFFWFGLLLWIPPLHAEWDPQLARMLASGDFDSRIGAIRQLVASGDPKVEGILKAMAEDALAVANDRLLRHSEGITVDLSTGTTLTPPLPAMEMVSINNRIRREIQAALALLRLFDAKREVRLTAAVALQNRATPEMVAVLERAMEKEQDPEIHDYLFLGLALSRLNSPDPAQRLTAVRALGDSSSPTVKVTLTRLLQNTQEPNDNVRKEAKTSLDRVSRRLAIGEAVASLFSGISLGSILLLTALGLAITYGVMGILNMAHGELLMIGAYTTFAVQTQFRAHLPELLDAYLLAAIPAAFVITGLVGVVMERTVIRWLYGRPLETLLATWGISLMLIQGVRLLFGAQNVEVANPSWMSGGVMPIPGVVLPWNRIVITVLALLVLAATWGVLNRTRLGLFVRAVTQNRAMAGCVGVPTSRVDTLAFGLGAGIAGLGGVAISQIANVGPDMGQGYIVDSFLVVVLGGVGQLAGAVWAALGLGIAAKALEGWVGAVIAKILMLVFIIVFIQKRPQGLFVLKGRQAEH
ncbi:MAG: urea ABC transporter permease subunit UrtB [Magnetococcales bacterium]|nr:urea ABC transporter permease subunit UrtB [Magnetococcales bacterium]